MNDSVESIKEDYSIIKSELGKNSGIKRVICLNCYLDIAYKMGQVYGDFLSKNRNLTILARYNNNCSMFRIAKQRKKSKIDFPIKYGKGNENSNDIVITISIKPTRNENIERQVKEALGDNDFGEWFLIQGEMLIKNGDILEDISDYL